jgi:hypothetical protein
MRIQIQIPYTAANYPNLELLEVQVEAGLERDVDEEDGGDEEVGGVVDGVVPQAGLQLPQERELARLGEALQADKRVVIQGASGIDARFLKLSPALTISPIMTKFSQCNPHSTCYYLLLVSIFRQD